MLLSGKVSFYLDDDLIAQKEIWVNDNSGFRNIELSICDDCQTDSKESSFTYDNIAEVSNNWTEGSKHYYKIIVDILNIRTLQDQFFFTGEFLAYELELTNEEAKQVVINDENNAISIYKTDSSLFVCGASFSTNENGLLRTPPTTVIVKQLDGTVLFEAFHYHQANGNIGTWGTTCTEYIGIPRNSELLFEVEGIDYPVTAPLPLKKYLISGIVGQRCSTSCGSFNDIISDFGYGLPLDTDWRAKYPNLNSPYGVKSVE